jgi:hypothetical protein
MDVPRLQTCLTLFATLFAVAACGDASPTAPASAQAAQAEAIQAQEKPETTATDLEAMSDRELLIAVMGKLNALEARMENESHAVYARIDSLISGNAFAGFTGQVMAAQEAKKGARAEAVVEAQICYEYDFRANMSMASTVALGAAAQAGAGVDAYGNGAQGQAGAFARQKVEVEPGASGGAVFQVCIRGNAGIGVEESPLIQDAVQIARSRVADMQATADLLGFDPTGLYQGIGSIASFSLSDLQFGRGAAPALVSSLPLPSDLANLMSDPAGILQRAADAGQYALDQLCSQTLFTGELAQLGSQACDLRDQTPSVAELIAILQGLDGLPNTLAALDGNLFSVCENVNDMLDASISIPRRQATIFAGQSIGTFSLERTFTTFPAFNADLFPSAPQLSFCA